VIALRSIRPLAHVIALSGLATFASVTILLGSPRPVAACSCVAFENLKQYATPENAIFTGTAGQGAPRGVPVTVGRWLWGRAAAPVVWLAASSFGDGASCGSQPPPAGSSWLWVGWLPDNKGDIGTGLCSPAWDLSTDEGKATLAQAVKLFGGVPPPQATPEPTPEAAPVHDPHDPAATTRDMTGLTIGAVLVGGSLAMFGALALLARWTRGPGDPGNGDR
jgi:hypothetical protein